METAVVLVSGGVNSAVAAAAAREQYDTALLHVNWGHRAAEREAQSFERIAADLRVEQVQTICLSQIAAFGGNARVSKRVTMEDASALGQGTPATFVLGLMPTLLSVATTWAGTIGARRIILGISEDHSVPGPPVSELYPDHRMEFVQAYNLMLAYAKPTRRELCVEAPLIELNRSEVVQLGQRLNVPFDKTWSCYQGGERPCGRCLACVTRTSGFMQANLPDPLELEAAKAKA